MGFLCLAVWKIRQGDKGFEWIRRPPVSKDIISFNTMHVH